jgi:hypothetical protein
MLGRPANPTSLVISRWIHSKHGLRGGSLVDVQSIDPLGLLAVDEKHVRVPSIVPGECSQGVGAGARSPEVDAPVLEPPCLALDPKKALARVDCEVVPLIDPEGNQDSITAFDQLREDCGLRALPYVHWMHAEGSGSV